MEQLMRMSWEETAKYQKYRCGNLKKARAIVFPKLIAAIIMLNAPLFFLKDQYVNRGILAILTVISIVMIIVYYFRTERKMKELKSENVPYEYAFTKAVMNQEQKIKRENGEEVTYKIRTGSENSFSNGQKIVVVYIPDGKRVYFETIEKWKEICEG